VSGLLFVATSTAIYAALILAISLWHVLFVRKQRILAAAVMCISLVTLLLCQSRAAQFAALVISLLYGLYLLRQKKLVALVPALVFLSLTVIPLVGGSYFARMRGEQIQSGLAYRGDVYRLSAKEVLQSHPVTGLGPSGVPVAINTRDHAPPGIIETLNQNYVFLSAHDVFLDTALYFGLIAGVAFLVLVLLAGFNWLLGPLTADQLLLGGVFFTVLANGLLNVPSVELTSLLFLMVITLLPGKIHDQRS
jgi:O-antigen ligase